MAKPRQRFLRVAVVDQDRVLRELLHLASVEATLRYTRSEWVSDESAVLHNLYRFRNFLWSGDGSPPEPAEATMPGRVELTRDEAAIHRDTMDRFNRYVGEWLQAVKGGTEALKTFSRTKNESYQTTLHSLTTLIETASQVNRDVARALTPWVRGIAAVKLGATIGVALTGLPGAATIVVGSTGGLAVVTGLNLGYGISCAIAGSVGETLSATAVAVAKPVGTFALGETGGWIEARRTGHQRAISQHTERILLLEAQGKRLNKELAEINEKLSRPIASRLDRRHLEAQRGVRQRLLREADSSIVHHGQKLEQKLAQKVPAAHGAKLLPIIAVGLDIYFEAVEFGPTWAGAGP